MTTRTKRHSRSSAAMALDLHVGDFERPDAEIVVLAPRTSSSVEANGTEMDAEIAASWELWSEQIGRALLPVLQRLQKAMPTLTSAMICTADGFNLCTLGVDESEVGKLSAMTSSLHSIADAVSSTVHEGESGPLDMVNLTNGSSTTVGLAIRNLIVGQLLLWVTAKDETLGVLLMRSKVAAEGVREILGED